MTDFSIKLSAYLDGELGVVETAEVEARLESDPQARVELDELIQADAAAQEEFEKMLDEPVPFALAQQIKNTTLEPRAAAPRPIWGTLAASLVMLVLGGAGGYLVRGESAPVQTAG
ncbi:MAG: anti-sigma factor, partial [Pseudomonadota bacterium]